MIGRNRLKADLNSWKDSDLVRRRENPQEKQASVFGASTIADWLAGLLSGWLAAQLRVTILTEFQFGGKQDMGPLPGGSYSIHRVCVCT